MKTADRLIGGAHRSALASLIVAGLYVAAGLCGAWSPVRVAPFVLQAHNVAERDQAVHCLAEAIYYEAGAEPIEGQRAVAQVVLNRVRDPRFTASVCGVVYQGARRAGCQFSFACDGSRSRRRPSAEQFGQARFLAQQALNGHVVAKVGAATHYHTDYVEPFWRTRLVQTAKIGAHIFYRFPGEAGRASALSADYEGGEVRVRARSGGREA